MRSGRVPARQRESAINVLVGTKLVRNWAKGELKFLMVDLDTPRGQKLLEEKCRELAARLIDNRA